ncbi:UNKNOWN [Stylonychia lemnae]|uniref:Uncharacterized protein n=1 Tax=Stylonychia lemnae TaxID=5949 RepID=A0A078AAV6_STYLE|nr:UNKNOWN [Stylonychia lemnae]|eukprot:CDW78742.1 UNKNOWN [Stylonychia lemnae]
MTIGVQYLRDITVSDQYGQYQSILSSKCISVEDLSPNLFLYYRIQQEINTWHEIIFSIPLATMWEDQKQSIKFKSKNDNTQGLIWSNNDTMNYLTRSFDYQQDEIEFQDFHLNNINQFRMIQNIKLVQQQYTKLQKIEKELIAMLVKIVLSLQIHFWLKDARK